MTCMRLKTSAMALMAFGFATPALAQDAICGGLGDNGTWIGGDEASSDIANAASHLEQMALVLGGNEYVSVFSLSAPTDVRIEAEGRGSGDPIIDLVGADGSLILSDDDSGGNGASRAETTLDAGTYCMSMRSYDGGPMTAFVRIGKQEHEPLTNGITEAVTSNASGSCADASDLGTVGASMTASANEVPFWRFQLDSPTPLTITAENESADPAITIYGPNDEYIAENDDADGLNSRIDWAEPLAAGEYCIEMVALSDDTAPITVSLSEYDAEAALQLLYARGEIAPPLDGSVPVTALGPLQTRLLQDVPVTTDVSWLSIEIAQDGLLALEAVGGANTDPWLIVFDELGRQVGFNDDHGDTLDSLVMARVQVGTYIIGIRKYEGGQDFVRLLAERYVRAQ